jgi:hypothetical protein
MSGEKFPSAAHARAIFFCLVGARAFRILLQVADASDVPCLHFATAGPLRVRSACGIQKVLVFCILLHISFLLIFMCAEVVFPPYICHPCFELEFKVLQYANV